MPEICETEGCENPATNKLSWSWAPPEYRVALCDDCQGI